MLNTRQRIELMSLPELALEEIRFMAIKARCHIYQTWHKEIDSYIQSIRQRITSLTD